ncbi:MAG: hypothetical protein Q8S73_24430 [Deltaproteobacteria bacterium]|nr:hypothetical protein [Myxococcales bacterium]MDP3217281.1 hypothetical protein [Deltaproteobacteria bacterium]
MIDLLGAPGHWRVAPAFDPHGHGQLHRGHTRTLPCAGCAASPIAPATLAPPPTPAARIVPAAERPTARVAGDATLVPTLRAPDRPSPWAEPLPRPATPACAVGPCTDPRAESLPSTHPARETLALLCSRHRVFARSTLAGGRATPETLLAYLEAAEARAAAPTAARDGTTVREGILLALASLGDGPVAISALVVRAWEREPARFGLAGYVDRYPNSNAVQAKLCGRDGLVERGWCTRTGTGELTLTPKGRRHAASLAPAMGGAR